MNARIAIMKRLLAGNWISMLMTVGLVACATTTGPEVLSRGNYTWTLAVLSPFFFVFADFRELLNLGASKKDYFAGCLMAYAVLALGISLANTLTHLILDAASPARTVVNLMDVCRWTENGIIIAWLQQTFFLLLAMLFLHVLLSVQSQWCGWLTDAVLAAVISIFTPIAPLRHVLAVFFETIMINGNALVQISSCLVLSALLSLAGLAALKRRTL